MVQDRSKLDAIQQKRKAYDPLENAASVVKVNTLIDAKFTRMVMTNNATGCPTSINYYDDRINEVNYVTPVADVCHSLNGKYFLLRTAKDAITHYVWYCTACPCITGNDPALACKTPIKVTIAANDLPAVIALATQQQVDCNAGYSSTLCSGGTKITITNATEGLATAAVDPACCGSGFTFEHVTLNCNRLTATVCITYDVCSFITVIDKTLGS